MDTLDKVQRCFAENRVLYTRHARHEMRVEEFGPISEDEVCEAIASGEIIGHYPAAEPYPVCWSTAARSLDGHSTWWRHTPKTKTLV